MAQESQEELDNQLSEMESLDVVNTIDNASLVYRSPRGTRIDREAWLNYLSDVNNGTKTTTVPYNGYDIQISKRYIGNMDKLYTIEVECSEDVTKYVGYRKSSIGAVSSENEYNRIIESVTLGEDITDKTVISPNNGGVALFYDARYGVYIVNLLSQVEAWKYPTRAMAEAKFATLIV